MRGVNVAFERLQVIAGALCENYGQFLLRQQRRFDLWERRGLLGGTHVYPDNTGAFGHLVRLGPHLLFEILVRRNARHVDAAAGNVELPAVIDAAQAILFIACEEQRSAAVRAAMVHHADPARTVAKADQLLAEHYQPERWSIDNQLRRHRRRYPVLSHQLPHHGPGADPRQLHAFRRRRHLNPPWLQAFPTPTVAAVFFTSNPQSMATSPF